MAGPRAGRDRRRGRRAAGAVAGGPVRAVLGPCVHPARYEFGADLLDRLVARFGPEVAGRTADGAPALDIPAAVRVRAGARPASTTSTTSTCAPRRRPTTSRTGATASPAARRVVVVRDAVSDADASTVAARVAEVRARIAAAAGRARAATRRRSRWSPRPRPSTSRVSRAVVAAGVRRPRREPGPGAAREGARASTAARAGTSSGSSSATRCGRSRRGSRAGSRSTAPELGAEIARRAPGARVLVEVNLAGGAAEGRLPPRRRSPALVDALRARRPRGRRAS